MRKKRVLFVNETMFVNSGYAQFSQEIIPRLYDLQKYEIASLDTYLKPDDPRRLTLPWKVYGNLPMTQQEEQVYNSHSCNKFGAWRFDDVCLDFLPDEVLAIRDNWMDSFLFSSPLRSHYSIISAPTVDSQEQYPEWLQDYASLEKCLTYTQFSKDVLESESGGAIHVSDVNSFGVNTQIFHTLKDKAANREKYGVPQNYFVVGTVMRNQPRKLFSELIEAFEHFIEQYPEIGQKTLLYLHTTYPDFGWDLPRIVKQSKYSHQILLTYLCRECDNVFASRFFDAKVSCGRCGKCSALLPSVYDGVNKQQLNEIYNLFDVYVQYSCSEGLGLGLLESAACGIPFMATDYSGMESVLQELGGYPIEVNQYFRECASHMRRAYPKKESFVEQLRKILSLPTSVRLKKGADCQTSCKKTFDWALVAKKWEKAIDECPQPQLPWDSPPIIRQPANDVPPNLNNRDFVRWCILNVMCEPSKLNTFLEARLVKNLNYGVSVDGITGINTGELGDPTHIARPCDFTHNDVFNQLLDYRKKANELEYRRANYDKVEKPLFVRIANNVE